MEKYYIKLIIILLLGLNSFSLLAQQDSQYTQYIYNTTSINPAYAGNRDVLSIVGLHRSQWVGLEGAPRTSTLSLHSPIGVNRRVGLGGSVINDEIGPSRETYISVDFSYTIPTSKHGKLSFGLKGTLQLIDVDFSKLTIRDGSDPQFLNSGGIDNAVNPNVGVGLYYHSKRFYAGLSAPNLLETEHFDRDNLNGAQSSNITSREKTNFYLLAGHVFDVSNNVKFKPSFITKVVNGSPLQVDVSANFLFYDKLTLGAAYRWDAAVSAIAGFQISDSLLIGFAYDYETTELQEFNNGSYELLLRFELFQKYSRIITPRFF